MGSWEVFNLSTEEIKALANTLPQFTEEELQISLERANTAMKELRASATSVEEAQRNINQARKELSTGSDDSASK